MSEMFSVKVDYILNEITIPINHEIILTLNCIAKMKIVKKIKQLKVPNQITSRSAIVHNLLLKMKSVNYFDVKRDK